MKSAKAYALANYLEIDVEDITEHGWTHNAEGYDYDVLNKEEREQQVTNYIKESLWAFNSSFLAEMTGLPEETFKLLSEAYERSNDAILALVERTLGLEGFVEEAVNADGYGHFLSSYDGEEIELEGDLYAYKV